MEEHSNDSWVYRMVRPAVRAETGRHGEVGNVRGCHLATPHELQAEPRPRKRERRHLVVFAPSKPMAEACQLHAVVRAQRWRPEPVATGQERCAKPQRWRKGGDTRRQSSGC